MKPGGGKMSELLSRFLFFFFSKVVFIHDEINSLYIYFF